MTDLIWAVTRLWRGAFTVPGTVVEGATAEDREILLRTGQAKPEVYPGNISREDWYSLKTPHPRTKYIPSNRTQISELDGVRIAKIKIDKDA